MTHTNTIPATTPVTFDCPSDLAADLTALAQTKGVSLSECVAGLVVTPLRDQLAEA